MSSCHVLSLFKHIARRILVHWKQRWQLANRTAHGTLSGRSPCSIEETIVSRLSLFLCCLPAALPAAEPKVVTIDDPLPFGQSPVDYLGETTSDPVARLGGLLASGKKTLRAVPGRGYLDSVLRALDVPVSSQLLVYSKTTAVHAFGLTILIGIATAFVVSPLSGWAKGDGGKER